MTPPDIPTARVSREKYIYYWRNATECYQGMQDAAILGRWHLTALNGIHCVIAAADALLVYTAQVRSKSKNHLDVFTLLNQHISDPERAKALQHGLQVLRQKTEVEYGAKRLNPADVQRLIKHVERFYVWVQDKLQ